MRLLDCSRHPTSSFMNPPAPAPVADPCLKLSRRAAAAGTAFSPATEWRLAADLEALREREENLRRYEARLRALQEQVDRRTAEPVRRIGAGDPVNPVSGAAADQLHTGWEKFHRAVALMEAEQLQLREERSTLRAERDALDQRENQLAAREAAVVERERALAAAVVAEVRKQAAATRTPWAAARSALTGENDRAET